MDFSPAARRTRVVDLGVMSREEIIEVAKKQAQSINEKTSRIQALEEMVEKLSGNKSTKKKMDMASLTSSLLDEKNNTGGNKSFDKDDFLALQQTIEEERLAFATEISRNDELISTLQKKLEAKTQELSLLEEKVRVWKEKVVFTAQKDQQIISELRSRLAQFLASSDTSSTVTTVPATFRLDVLETAVQKKLGVWEEQLKERMQEYLDRIKFFEGELESYRSTQHVTTSALETTHSAQDGNRLLSTQTSSLDKDLGFPVLNQALTEELIEQQVEQRVQKWKERVKETIEADRQTIQQLQQQLQAFTFNTNESEICFDAPTEVVTTIGRTAVSQVRQLQETMKCMQQGHNGAIKNIKQDVERLRHELDEARRGRDEVRSALLQRESADATVGTMKEELERLRHELDEARRGRDEVRSAYLRLFVLKEERDRAQHEFCENINFLRVCVGKLQVEIQRLVAERLVMSKKLKSLDDFKSMVVDMVESTRKC